jgi:nicotinate phosphoribosyltransferase
VFPLIPLLRVEGPLALCQVLETTLLTLTNFPSLVATNATRYRLAAESSGKKVTLLEFGLRRAQGPDGGISASRYSYLGGFHGTSNVEAGHLFDIGVKGTHAHAFVCAFTSFADNEKVRFLEHAVTKEKKDFIEIVKSYREKVPGYKNANEGELAAFSAYAVSFPSSFLALIDTYHTMKSGVINFICVALALTEMGYDPVGIRLDSGDLAYLSKQVRKFFVSMEELFGHPFSKLQICASSDISEATLFSLNQQGHEIDIFGIGTNLVTCSGCPALGCVYKLVNLNNQPRLKLSNAPSKITLPGRKHPYRLFGKDGMPVADIMVDANKEPPKQDEPVYCRHPFDETKRAYVRPSAVHSLHTLVWDGKIIAGSIIPLSEARENLLKAIKAFRADHLRSLNPTPYKVCLSADLYEMFHNLWLKEAPIEEIT